MMQGRVRERARGEGGCTVLNCWSKKARVITGKALMKPWVIIWLPGHVAGGEQYSRHA